MRVVFLAFLFILGACFGSFLCCQARRLRIKELAAQKPSKKGKKPTFNKRSVCLHCQKPLKWYDNLPLISWFILGGKCRFCGQKISFIEPLSEFGLAIAFLLFGLNFDLATTNPLVWGSFIVSLILLCLLGFLAIYDAISNELPTIALIASIILAIILAILNFAQRLLPSTWTPELILPSFGSVAILGGTYLALYLFSRGKWVGDGDWMLGLALGAALSNPWLALITLCLANLLACVTTLPNYKKHLRIPLGPFLIIAFVITYSFQDFFLDLL